MFIFLISDLCERITNKGKVLKDERTTCPGEYKKVKVKSLSHVQLFETPWTVAYQAPLSMGFSGQPRQHIKKQRHYLANKGPSSQSYGFSSSHVWM